MIGKLFNSMAKSGIGCKIECRSGVIQNQNLRFTNKRPGNGQSRTLTAGEIASSLFDRRIQSFRFGSDKFGCLCRLKRFPDLFIRSPGKAEMHIFTNRTAEQKCLLKDIGDGLADIR